MVNAKVYEVRTRCHTRRAALKQLERFESDPENFNPRGGVGPEPLFLDLALSKECLRWSRDEKQNSIEWVERQRRA